MLRAGAVFVSQASLERLPLQALLEVQPQEVVTGRAARHNPVRAALIMALTCLQAARADRAPVMKLLRQQQQYMEIAVALLAEVGGGSRASE